MRRINKNQKNCNNNINKSQVLDNLSEEGFDVRLTLIQELIPIGLMAVNDILQQEVISLAGARYNRMKEKRDIVRWGRQQGSVYLQDTKVKIRVPRVRNRKTDKEVVLSNYRKLQEPLDGDKNLLVKVLNGLLCHKYSEAAQKVPEVPDWCIENNVVFVLGQTAHTPFREKASELIEKAKRLYSLKKEPIILYGECLYQADSWSIKRRIIFKVEYNENGAKMWFIVTNLRHTRKRFIYEIIYCGRGNMENYM